jgi:plastocyanin
MNKKFVITLAGVFACLLLSVVVSACKIVDASTIPPAVEVEMSAADFVVSEITINKGESLSLVSLAAQHDITNGYWDGNTQVAEAEAGAPAIGLVQIPDGGSGIIGPFTTAGEFRIYCTLHPGMNLLVIVE